MERYWLLTWTTYGTWLPGDARGFVGRVRDGARPRIEHDIPGTEYDANMPGLKHTARSTMTGSPICLTSTLAGPLHDQFLETAAHRDWQLLASAIMWNHVHLVVGVPGDPEPHKLLQSFKSYGSRKLNEIAGRPGSGTWWTSSGSTRRLKDEPAVLAAIEYVKNQFQPLLVWLNSDVSPQARPPEPIQQDEDTDSGSSSGD